MDHSEWQEWQARLSPEAQARDKANNHAQAHELLAYAVAMGWLQTRAAEADERIQNASLSDSQNAQQSPLRSITAAAGKADV